MPRNRIRVGRKVLFTPSAANATAYGDGPWLATITAVASDGSVSLSCELPSQEATADGSDAGTTQTLANALKARYNAAHPTGVLLGGGAGQFALEGLSDI